MDDSPHAMSEKEIETQVSEAIERWTGLPRALEMKGRSVSPQAKALLVTFIMNIERDPSPLWRVRDNASLVAAQRYAIDVLPNILNDVQRGMRYRDRTGQLLTTWEILHSLSRVLDDWCPIPKS